MSDEGRRSVREAFALPSSVLLEVDPRPWVPVRAVLPAYVASLRSASRYSAALDALPLLDSPRYQPHDGNTFCNIFVWDATILLGCEIPHWVDPDGNTTTIGGGREQTANDMADWLERNGKRDGWGRGDPETVQRVANRGNPAVAVWRNSGGVGHIAMVRPGQLHPEKGPCIAQAGARNFRHGHVLDGFGHRNIYYFVHIDRTPVVIEHTPGMPPLLAHETAEDLRKDFEASLLSPIGTGRKVMAEAEALLKKHTPK